MGDLCADQVVDLVVKLTFPDGAVGQAIDVAVAVEARGEAPVETRVSFTFADHGANDRQPRAVPIDRLVAGVYAADARRKAIVMNRAGDYQAAAKLLSGTAARVKSYAFGDVELARLAEALEQDAATYGRAMDELSGSARTTSRPRT
ncbi:MAG: hypothetical protein U1F43_09310 [Myxococcota bacterium]